MAYDTTQANSFWHFACSVYDEPNKAKHLLFLQDHHHANVLITLLMMWFDNKQQPLLLSNILAFIAIIEPIEQTLIVPCRQLRQNIKAELATNDAYQQVKILELQLERMAADKLVTKAKCLVLNNETFLENMNLHRYLLSVLGIPMHILTELGW